MSKWKYSGVKIVQIIHGEYRRDLFGLGDDGKVYKWKHEDGAWEKFWIEKDKPNE